MSLDKACMIAIKNCMNVQKNETVLIVTDNKSRSLGYSLLEAALKLKCEAGIMEMRERDNHGEEPPGFVAEAIKSAAAVLIPTTKSLSHTDARRKATEAGSRIATMPGITEEMMIRTLNADYYKIARLSNHISQILTDGAEAYITSPSGTEISLCLRGRNGKADTGLLHDIGSFGNLPAGEAMIAPVEGNTHGVFVVDGAMAGLPTLDNPIVIYINQGCIEQIEGGNSAGQFKKIIEDTKDPNAKNVAELGIGTNDKAKLGSSLLEVEKVLGTVHLGFGDSISMGGKVSAPIHVDGVTQKPTVKIDGTTIIRDGNLCL